MSDKNTKDVKSNKLSLLTGVKCASIIGTITLLAFVFMTKDGFSQWKEKEYFPTKAKLNQSVAILKERDRVYHQNIKDIKTMFQKILDK